MLEFSRWLGRAVMQKAPMFRLTVPDTIAALLATTFALVVEYRRPGLSPRMALLAYRDTIIRSIDRRLSSLPPDAQA